MKKILLGTTALIGAATMLAGAALADDPKVTVGGFNNFEAAFVKDDFDGQERDRSFRNDTEIHFNIAGKTDFGLGYGAEIDLEADVNGNPSALTQSSASTAAAQPGNTGQGIVAHRTYAWVQGDNWGHFEYGSNDGAARTMKVDASNIARATGGIDGDWSLFADNDYSVGSTNVGGSNSISNARGALAPSAVNAGGFITAPRLPVEHGPSSFYASDVWGNDSKVTYYTPRFSGLQLGASYAPDLYSRGELTNRVAETGVDLGDIFEGGINYETQYDQVGMAFGATGEIGHSNSGEAKDLRAWNGGAKFSLAGFSLAGSYGDWLNSFDLKQNQTGPNRASDYWTGGVAYETGPVGASVTYLGSRDRADGYDNRFDDVSVGVDYKLAPGLTPFAEYTYFSERPSGGVGSNGGDNRGNVVIIGSQLSF